MKTHLGRAEHLDQRNTPKRIALRFVHGVLLLALLAVGAGHATAAEAPNAGPLTIAAQAGGLVTLTGEDTALTPAATIDVDGPLAIGEGAPLRVRVELRLTTLPGESIDLADPQTFRGATVDVSLRRIVGRLASGDQEITTAVVALAGFGTRLSAEPGPVDRLIRRYAGGVRLAEARSGAELAVLFGRDELAAEAFGLGQVLVRGRVPVPATAGVAHLVGDAVLSVGREDGARDVLRVGVQADLGRALELAR